MGPNGQLTPRQAKFVAAYLQHGEGARAAREAGYSPKCAKEQATRLLTYAHICEAIRQGQRKAQQAAEVTAEQITKELAKIGFATVRDPVTLSNKIKALELLVRQVHLANLEERLSAIEDALARPAPTRGGLRVI